MPQRPPVHASAKAVAAAKGPTEKALEKLGLERDIDLALHLPLRYEDETRISRLRDVREGDTVQIEAVVTHCEVSFRPRRQLVVTVDDGSDVCTLRFFNFYPSQQKALAVGSRIRARGEAKGGFLGWTMLHPVFRPAQGDLPKSLTPIYPTVAGLPQHLLRKAVLAGLASADLSDTFSPGDLSQFNQQALWTLRDALAFLHHPRPDAALATLQDQTHPAWQRLKAEELLAQQISQLQTRRTRAHLRAPVLKLVAPESPERPGAPPKPVLLSLHAGLLAKLPFGLTAAQQRVGEEIARDMAR
ncbi:MAG: ATP-dependent DNA helicase RecG, partial [Rhodoferax sp.]